MKIREDDNIQRLLPKEKQQVAVDKNITKRKLADARADLRRHNDLYGKYQQLQVESPRRLQTLSQRQIRILPRSNDSK